MKWGSALARTCQWLINICPINKEPTTVYFSLVQVIFDWCYGALDWSHSSKKPECWGCWGVGKHTPVPTRPPPTSPAQGHPLPGWLLSSLIIWRACKLLAICRGLLLMLDCWKLQICSKELMQGAVDAKGCWCRGLNILLGCWMLLLNADVVGC